MSTHHTSPSSPYYERYEHHGAQVWVNSDLKGKHRDLCLCFACGKFKPGTAENCAKASELYEFCRKHNMVTPVFECTDFVLPVCM